MNANNKQLQHFTDRWAAFLVIILDPINFFLLLIVVLLYIFSIRQEDINSELVAVLTLILTLLTGLLGGIYAKRWEDITNEKVIITRGKSANRSLQLLLGSAISLEKRVRLYLERLIDENYQEKLSHEVLRTYLEEIIEECVSLEQEVINSIEDWIDIIPEAEIKTVLSLISELKSNYSKAKNELYQVNTSLQETREKSSEEINKLELEKKVLEKNLRDISQKVQDTAFQAGVPSLGGSLLTSGSYSSLGPSYTITMPGEIPYIESPYVFFEVTEGPSKENSPSGLFSREASTESNNLLKPEVKSSESKKRKGKGEVRKRKAS